MASTIDGRIALRGRKPLKLSSEEDFARVHRLRSECQAVLVGVETVIADDPKLTVKEELVPGASNRSESSSTHGVACPLSPRS